jgi:signal transduction histidine kinase
MPYSPINANDARCQEMLQTGLDLLDQGLSIFDNELRLVAWNRPFLDLLGFPEHLARIGTPYADFIRYKVAHGEYGLGDPEQQFADRLSAAQRFQPEIREHRRPNGKLLLLRAEPLPGGGFVTLYSDITEQRYLEHLTEHQNIQLDERVRRRTAQLENANANLRRALAENERMQAALLQAQKMEAIGQLTGGLAHDFNNLLTVIIGNLAALQDHNPTHSAIGEYVEPALQSARRGVHLIKRLLTFSRQQALEPQAVDITQLINELARLTRRSLPESIKVDLSAVDIPGEGKSIHALVDPAQLESALLNFALNARDAMPEGGELRVAARAIELNADAVDFDVTPGDYALIEIIDNGCGMDAKTLARACEPFFTTKRLGLGSGLGLPMAYGFVRQSGGGMLMHSQPGQGTHVQIVLPRTTAPIIGSQVNEPELPAANGELVLLVEDEPNVRRVVRQQLVDLGHPVIEAENAAQAMEMVAQIPDIAIVVSDILMPGELNGRQLAEHLLREYPRMQIVLMSGYTDEGDDGSNERLPVLAKPFIRQDLARALQLGKKERS